MKYTEKKRGEHKNATIKERMKIKIPEEIDKTARNET